MTKKKSKTARKTLAERLEEARSAGFSAGFEEGRAAGRREFGPNSLWKDALTDFAQQIKGWPIDGADVVALIGTDLKHICNMAIPARTAKAIANELERLGYKR